MKTIELGKSGMQVPALAVGCMRIVRLDKKERARFVDTALELGLNMFDHADVYGSDVDTYGYYERLFSEALDMTPSFREKIILQSKCGIALNSYTDPKPGCAGADFSKEHILMAVDEILKNLKTDYLDSLLLHMPDLLVEPEEVAEAFDILEQSGKVRHFGVSNHSPWRIELLKKYVKQPLVANQIQLGLAYNNAISQNYYFNLENPKAIAYDGGDCINYCRVNDMTIQCWSPLQSPYFGHSDNSRGVYIGDREMYPELNDELNRLAEKYEVSPTTIGMAWLLRHPAKLQPVTGTMNLEHLRQCAQAADVTLTRNEWYTLWHLAGNPWR